MSSDNKYRPITPRQQLQMPSSYYCENKEKETSVGLVTTLDYAEMARRVYNIDKSANNANCDWVLGNYKCDLFEEGMAWGGTKTDFKGCVYSSEALKEAVVAFQGTVPRKGGDLLADLQIAIGGLVGMLPQYSSAALRLFERTVAVYPDHSVSLVGHSLGGAMAQVIGHWTGIPFVTFNAPGMWGDIQKSKVMLLWSPSSSWHSIKGTTTGSAFAKLKASTGRNFRNVMDPVSGYGSHYGPVTRFWGKGVHSMDDILERVRKSRWANIKPFDPAHKEWGDF